MLATNILRLDGESNTIEISFNKKTTTTMIAGLELSKHDLMQISLFIDSAINAKLYKEKKENSFLRKLEKKFNSPKELSPILSPSLSKG